MRFPKKVFVMGPSGNLILKDQDIHIAFIKERVDRLIAVHNDELKFNKELEAVFAEFVDIFNYDKQTAERPEPFGSFKDDSEKQAWMERHLMAQEFEYHLGGILYNYHDRLIDLGFPDIVLHRLIVDYPGIYERALYDYVAVLKKLPPHYPFQLEFKAKVKGATEERERIKGLMQHKLIYGGNKPFFAAYALPSLIECYSIGFMQHTLFDKCVKDTLKLNENGTIILDASDMVFLKDVRDKRKTKNGSKEDAMERSLQIFTSAGIPFDKDKTEVLLARQGKRPLTLGAFLKNSYAKSHIKKCYYDVLDMLFSTQKVNLRNSIMHGADILTDPFSLCFSAVMLQIFWGVIDKSIYV